jgi:hypothetical protein
MVDRVTTPALGLKRKLPPPLVEIVSEYLGLLASQTTELFSVFGYLISPRLLKRIGPSETPQTRRDANAKGCVDCGRVLDSRVWIGKLTRKRYGRCAPCHFLRAPGDLMTSDEVDELVGSHDLVMDSSVDWDIHNILCGRIKKRILWRGALYRIPRLVNMSAPWKEFGILSSGGVVSQGGLGEFMTPVFPEVASRLASEMDPLSRASGDGVEIVAHSVTQLRTEFFCDPDVSDWVLVFLREDVSCAMENIQVQWDKKKERAKRARRGTRRKWSGVFEGTEKKRKM